MGNNLMDDELSKWVENEIEKAREQRAKQVKEVIAQELTSHGDLLPPWEKYPMIARGSIGWRMGGGESYMRAWDEWAGRMSKLQLVEYFRKYLPIPIEWLDWVSNRFGDEEIFEEMYAGGGNFDGIRWLEQQGLAKLSEFKTWYDKNGKDEKGS